MKSSYNSTKEKNLNSYEYVLFTYLLKLGFKINNKGTKYLIKLTLFILSNHLYTDIEDINIDCICSKFLKENPQINISKRTFKGRLEYAINNSNTKKLKENFASVLNVDYDYYLITLKNIIILFLYLCNKDN